MVSELPYGAWDDARAARIAAWPSLALGSDPDPEWRNKQGLAVTLRLSPITAPIVASYSTDVLGVVGEGNAVLYDDDGVHVTVATMQMPQPMLDPEAYARHVQDVLFVINDCVDRAVGRWQTREREQPSVTFEGIAANASTIVVAGQASESLYRLRCLIVEYLRADPLIKKLKLKVKGSWGAHVTFSRLLVKLAQGDPKLAELCQLLAGIDQGIVRGLYRLQFVDVSTMTCTGGQFTLDRYHWFPLLF